MKNIYLLIIGIKIIYGFIYKYYIIFGISILTL